MSSRANGMHLRLSAGWSGVWVALLLAPYLHAQQTPTPNPIVPGGQNTQAPGRPTVATEPPLPTVDRPPRDSIDPTWNRLQPATRFQGFPIFPSRLSGYGGYPGAGQNAAGGLPFVPKLAPAPPEAPDWPSWVRLRNREPLPFAPDKALLVRHADRVWWRATPEAAFVPLFFHDKIGAVGGGTEVQVRQTGEFELLLHDSGRLVAQGPTDLRIAATTATEVVLEVRAFTRLRLQGNRRNHSLVLPDGSRLVVPVAQAPEAVLPGAVVPDSAKAADDTSAEAVAAAESAGPTLVLLERIDEPAWFGGRASIFNAGPRQVVLQGALGETKLPPGHRLWIFLQPPAAPSPASLVAGGALTTAEGAAVRLDAPQGGTVSWCGACFALPPGGTVRFLPIQGRPFDSPATPRPDKTP